MTTEGRTAEQAAADKAEADAQYEKFLRIAAVLEDLIDVRAEKTDLENREKDLLAELRHLIPAGRTVKVGDTEIRVANGRRTIDKNLVESTFPPETHPHLYKSVPNTVALREHLGSGVDDLYGPAGDPVVSVKG